MPPSGFLIVSDPSSWIDWWMFFAVASEKCLGPRGGQATTKAIQQLSEEAIEEVLVYIFVLLQKLNTKYNKLIHINQLAQYLFSLHTMMLYN